MELPWLSDTPASNTATTTKDYRPMQPYLAGLQLIVLVALAIVTLVCVSDSQGISRAGLHPKADAQWWPFN